MKQQKIPEKIAAIIEETVMGKIDRSKRAIQNAETVRLINVRKGEAVLRQGIISGLKLIPEWMHEWDVSLAQFDDVKREKVGTGELVGNPTSVFFAIPGLTMIVHTTDGYWICEHLYKQTSRQANPQIGFEGVYPSESLEEALVDARDEMRKYRRQLAIYKKALTARVVDENKLDGRKSEAPRRQTIEAERTCLNRQKIQEGAKRLVIHFFRRSNHG